MLKLCTLASGSNGNCTYISDGETNILIDVGISARSIIRELSVLGIGISAIDAIFLTHEHSDHICGLETLAKRNGRFSVLASAGTRAGVLERIPSLSREICELCEGEAFKIGKMTVTPFKTPHDTAESFGYRIECGKETAVVATDIGFVDEKLLEKLLGADVLLLEANYDERRLACGKYPQFLKNRISGDAGHLSNKECARCVVRAGKSGTKHVLLGHLSAENNTPETAYTEVHSALTGSGMIPGVDIMLTVAPRGKRGEIVTVGE